MNDNIIYLKDLKTRDNLSAPAMLRAVADENPKEAFVITWPQNGHLPSYFSSTGDVPLILMRLSEFIHKVYNGEFDEK